MVESNFALSDYFIILAVCLASQVKNLVSFNLIETKYAHSILINEEAATLWSYSTKYCKKCCRLSNTGHVIVSQAVAVILF